MKIVRMLLFIGLVGCWYKPGFSLLQEAQKFQESAQELAGEKPKPANVDNDLLEAAKYGCAAVVKKCLILNPQANIELALTFAAMHGYVNVLNAIINTAQKVTSDQYLQALCSAAQYGQLTIVREILPNIKRTTENKFTKVIKGLFPSGSDATKKTMTPLMEACRYAHHDIVYELLNNENSNEKSTLDARDSTDMTALIWACKTAYKHPDHTTMTDIITQLVDAQADVNKQDISGWTALMYAVEKNNSGAVNKLLSVQNIDVNHKSKNDDRNALTIAYFVQSKLTTQLDFEENTAIIELLLRKGAKTKVKMLPVKKTLPKKQKREV
jgi:ankyrin repeat protein